MIVFTSDVDKLIKDVIAKYEAEAHVKFGEPSIQQFFESLIKKVNKVTRAKLNTDTFYKHYYIKIKTHSSSEIGYSVGYLNGLAQYAYACDYLDKFPRVLDDEQEIPEFPYEHPCFPATPAVRIEYGKYTNLWIKDESYNPTGSHKDRKAHELYLFYRKIIKEQIDEKQNFRIPRLSLISTGNAALAIQERFRKHGLPDVKVLVHKAIDPKIYDTLIKKGAEVYMRDLTQKRYSSEDILEATDNKDGIDITYGDEVGHLKDSYYDWLSYECLNLNPEYMIMPYGSGDLYRGMLEVHVRELKSKTNSRRYFGNRTILRDCNFIGVRCEEGRLDTKLYFLLSYYDAHDEDEAMLDIQGTYCGPDSRIVRAKENEETFAKALHVMEKNNISTKCLSGLAGMIYLIQREEEGNPIDYTKKIVIINTGGDFLLR